ncbi:hypothetical protein D3C81_1764240 [compost metagenome]
MPNNPTFTATILALEADPFDQPLDAENLLITSDDLADLFIEQGVIANHLQQASAG